MIQDIGNHRLDIHYDPAAVPCENDWIIVFKDRYNILTGEDDQDIFPSAALLADWRDKMIYLFRLDSRKIFIIVSDEVPAPSGYSYVNIRSIRKNPRFTNEYMLISWTAYQLYKWNLDNKFCGTCGSSTVHSDTERAQVCTKCGRIIYPRIMPAVIVAVTNGDKIVLTRYAGRSITYNALIAGFTEIGETLEQTVEREVMEEVGLKVKNIRYYKSQPWAIASDLLAGFYCEVDGDPTITVDKSELASAVWTAREDIELQPDSLSLTNEMMKRFKDGLE